MGFLGLLCGDLCSLISNFLQKDTTGSTNKTEYLSKHEGIEKGSDPLS